MDIARKIRKLQRVLSLVGLVLRVTNATTIINKTSELPDKDIQRCHQQNVRIAR